MNRREFLRRSTLLPAAFGLEALGCGRAATPQSCFDDARRKMKEAGRHGVVLVVPEDETARGVWGRAFQQILEMEEKGHRTFLSSAVFVFVPRALATERLPGAPSDQNRYLLSPEGALVRSDALHIGFSDPPVTLSKSFGAFLEKVAQPAGAEARALPYGVVAAVGEYPDPCAYCGMDGGFPATGKILKFLGR